MAYNCRGDYSRAFNYLQIAIKSCLNNDGVQKHLYCNILNNMGIVLKELAHYHKSLKYF